MLVVGSEICSDADALNALATDPSLQTLLKQRAARSLSTVLTPHPLEAARLLGCSTQAVQASRLKAAQQLAGQYHCTAVIKGSGTVIASFGQLACINPTGNARLATAGTGDVLAGMVGAQLALRDELFVDDALIFDALRSRGVQYGADEGPQLKVEFADFPTLGVWSKPDSGFVCIEPWQGSSDPEGFIGDIHDKPGIVLVEPGIARQQAMSITLHG